MTTSTLHHIPNRTKPLPPLRVGIGGPVGSGKTMLCLRLCQKLRERYSMGVVTNDIYTKEDAEFLTRASALAPCPKPTPTWRATRSQCKSA